MFIKVIKFIKFIKFIDFKKAFGNVMSSTFIDKN